MPTARVAWLLAAALAPAGFPQAEISNGVVTARFYLPDAERGYYRGTRFDWSGNTYSLRALGHEYAGQWFERYDPKLHDAIMGPVEEFLTGDSSLGYAEAPPGGTFVRIGVGVVRKPEDKPYERFRTYEIVDPGKWTVKAERDRIEFRHELRDGAGYAYDYRKTVRLLDKAPVMTIEHSLRNTGTKPIETSQYNHNFFVIDGMPTGPDARVRFVFEPKAGSDLRGLAEVRGRELAYLRELQPGESLFTELAGFGPSARDYDLRIEHARAGAGVRIEGDRPLCEARLLVDPQDALPGAVRGAAGRSGRTGAVEPALHVLRTRRPRRELGSVARPPTIRPRCGTPRAARPRPGSSRGSTA